MATPQRVIDEAAEAQRQLQKLGAQLNGDTPPVEGDTPRDPDTQFGVGQQVTEIPAGGESSTSSGPVDAEGMAKLQQRLATLEGNFGRQSAELQAARERNNILERTLERALERGTERPTAPVTPAPSAQASVTDAEIEEYGADLTDFVRRLIRDGIQSATSPLLDKIQHLTASLSETSTVARSGAAAAAQSVDDRYRQRMDEMVKNASGQPDWEDINHMHETKGDSRFVDWLKEIGEDSDEPRLNIIQRAYARRDADRCARMINNFKRDLGMADGTKPVESPTQTTSARAAALVSPSTTGSGTGGAPRGRPPQKTYTQADIEKHYDEKVKGRWKGREAEWLRIADDMDKAVLDQRFTVEPRNARGR